MFIGADPWQFDLGVDLASCVPPDAFRKRLIGPRRAKPREPEVDLIGACRYRAGHPWALCADQLASVLLVS